MPRQKRSFRPHFPVSKTITNPRTKEKEQYFISGVGSNKFKAKRLAKEQRKYGKNARVIPSGKTKGKQKAPIKKGYRFSTATGPKRGRWAVYTKPKNKRKTKRKTIKKKVIPKKS